MSHQPDPRPPANPELAARCTLAAALTADFRLETSNYLDRTGPEPDWSVWAWRLYMALSKLLVLLEVPGSGDPS